MPSKGYSSFTNSTITITTGGSYVGDGTNGWTGGTAYSFTVQSRKLRQMRPREETTDSGFGSGVGGPITWHVELVGFFKTGTIPPVTVTSEFILVSIQIVQTLTAVIEVAEFAPEGTIGTSLKYTISGDSDGTWTYA